MSSDHPLDRSRLTSLHQPTTRPSASTARQVTVHHIQHTHTAINCHWVCNTGSCLRQWKEQTVPRGNQRPVWILNHTSALIAGSQEHLVQGTHTNRLWLPVEMVCMLLSFPSALHSAIPAYGRHTARTATQALQQQPTPSAIAFPASRYIKPSSLPQKTTSPQTPLLPSLLACPPKKPQKSQLRNVLHTMQACITAHVTAAPLTHPSHCMRHETPARR